MLNFFIISIIQFNTYKFFRSKEKLEKWIKSIIIVSIILFMISLIIYRKHPFLNYLIFYFLPLFFIYEDKIEKKAFYSLFFYGMEAIIISITKFILFVLIDEGILNEVIIIVVLWFSFLILFAVVQVIIFKFLKKQNIKKLLDLKFYRISLFFMIAGIYGILLVPCILEKKGVIINEYIPKVTLGFIFFTLALLISLYFLLIFNFYKTMLIEKNRVQSIEIRVLNESLKERKILNEEKIKLVHDMKNHNIMMALLVKKGKYDELLEYIKEFNDDIDATSNKEITSNLILNSILKFKREEALKKEIVFNVDCRVSRKIKINSFDITILFGNLIDNAIEENERINSGDKFININIWENDWILFFAIENLTSSEKFKDENLGKLLKTKKNDKENHGIGIKNANKIIKKYNGFMEFKKEKNIFMVSGYMNKNDD